MSLPSLSVLLEVHKYEHSLRKKASRFNPETHVKTTLVIRKDLHRGLRTLMVQTERTMTDLLEDAVRAYLENEKRARKD